MRERSRGTRRHHEYERETRCTSMVPMLSGMFRCIMERGDGHTEHQYNYFRSLTKQEKAKWFLEGESQIEKDE